MIMMEPTAFKVGAKIGELSLPPVTRHLLALYLAGAHDESPIHVDIDVARASGFDDVIAQGMLSMAWLGRLLTDCVEQSAVASFECRFHSSVLLGDQLHCTCVVDEPEQSAPKQKRLRLEARNQAGDLRTSGWAVLK